MYVCYMCCIKQTRHQRHHRRKENDLRLVVFKDQLKSHHHHLRRLIVQEVFIQYLPVQMAHRKFAHSIKNKTHTQTDHFV